MHIVNEKLRKGCCYTLRGTTGSRYKKLLMASPYSNPHCKTIFFTVFIRYKTLDKLFIVRIIGIIGDRSIPASCLNRHKYVHILNHGFLLGEYQNFCSLLLALNFRFRWIADGIEYRLNTEIRRSDAGNDRIMLSKK